jgi:hypothetical protein
MRDALLGAFLGLLLGLGLALLRERADDRLHTREEIEQAAELPVLAELPLDALAIDEPRRLAAFVRPVGRLAESVRSLRTSLAFLGVDGPLSRLLVTSAEPGDGKSLVAANLAAVYAQAGYRTILVDSDLRNPRLETIFGGYPPAGTCDAPSGLSGLIAALSSVPRGITEDGIGNGISNGHSNSNGHSGNGTGTSDRGACPAGAGAQPTRTGVPPGGPAATESGRAVGIPFLTHSSSILCGRHRDPRRSTVARVTDPAVLAAKASMAVPVASIDRMQRGAPLAHEPCSRRATGARVVEPCSHAEGRLRLRELPPHWRPRRSAPRRFDGPFRSRSEPKSVADHGAHLDLGPLEPDLRAAPTAPTTDGKPQHVAGGSVSGSDG